MDITYPATYAGQTEIRTMEILDLETRSRRFKAGAAGYRAMVRTDDDGETFFVVICKTARGIAGDSDEVSTAFSDLGAAHKWAVETLHARAKL